jgi:hypothetical protein
LGYREELTALLLLYPKVAEVVVAKQVPLPLRRPLGYREELAALLLLYPKVVKGRTTCICTIGTWDAKLL